MPSGPSSPSQPSIRRARCNFCYPFQEVSKKGSPRHATTKVPYPKRCAFASAARHYLTHHLGTFLILWHQVQACSLNECTPNLQLWVFLIDTVAISLLLVMASTGYDFVFHSYDAGFIVLSYLVSVVGCWTALELLHKRTSSHGLYNWYLLLGAATAMGAVAIWSMHYIGNRAITMNAGQPEFQIGYNPGYTAGSFFLPICVVAVAFYLFTVTEQVTFTGTIAGGCLTGFAICGMHYLGQGGISNYQPSYDWRYVLGSAIIAVVAATLALGVFFYFRSGWTNTWWKRWLCALLLAVAVSGMHWMATVGTSYVLRSFLSADQNGLSRKTTVAVVLCLAIGCCLTLIAFAIIGQRNRQGYADRAQQVVLACATWDQDGRLLVNPEGLLPCHKITNSFIERSFDDIFTVEHPVFHWIYRASRNWSGVSELVPGMRTHLRATSFVKRSRPSSAAPSRDHPDASEDYSQVFKELFCIAAYDLAMMFQEPLETLGILYDEIVSTGTLKKSRRPAKSSASTESGGENHDVERALARVTFGRGQLLFLVRRANKLESAQLQASGFRFAPVPQVLEQLARSMQVTVKELRPRLERMKDYPAQLPMLEPGVHLACFALRPLVQRGFDILVPKEAKNLLPTVALPMAALDMWQIDFITRFDDWEVGKCLQWLSQKSILDSATARERLFFGQLYNGIYALCQQISDEFFQSARLTARPLRAPCGGGPDPGSPSQAEIIAFRVIADVHQSRLVNDRFEFTPARFFLCQQHVYPKSPDHAIFARKAHREFASMLERKDRDINARNSGINFRRNFFGRMPSSPGFSNTYLAQRDYSRATVKEDSSSEKRLVDEPTIGQFGGIHVSNEVTIDVSELRQGDRSPHIEMATLGVFTEAGVAPVERETYIDELMSLTISERRQQR